ncbi:hypothetical protein F7725_001484 [Dissostichus mawsoni]|uniref:CSN8/PSMD8/EIF3K domain-containing protein n=1 Tax=Dissostichus mawsoni TaxID=36200 RepID=A0A7J5XZQ5_DISMA|nr:hypothetical protein F7725_001484 [Dissostichus mawsoni]
MLIYRFDPQRRRSSRCKLGINMPAAVIMEENYDKVLEQCEAQELEANPELTSIWAVGQRIWQRDFPGVYTTIAAFQWTENILPVMEALRESTRQRAYSLVAQAYTSLAADDFAAFVGYSVEEAVKGVVSQGWQADPATRMVMPKKPDPPPVSLVPNEQQLARLTDYVAFLEN